MCKVNTQHTSLPLLLISHERSSKASIPGTTSMVDFHLNSSKSWASSVPSKKLTTTSYALSKELQHTQKLPQTHGHVITRPSSNLTNKMKLARPKGRSFLIFSLASIVFLCLLASLNELRFETVLKFRHCALSKSPRENQSPDGSQLRILIGILTLPDHYLRRHFLRTVYGTQSTGGARVDVKFVFCNLTKEDQRVLVALEIMRYDDIIIMDCWENMNSGKTYTYFSSLPGMLVADSAEYPPYHYVMKGDDDTYFRLENLVESLKPLPRKDLYYGFVIPCPSWDPFVHYMSGMGYLVSWDIVEWISGSDIPKNNLLGSEDRIFGEWLRDGRRARNRYNAKWSMYNYPNPPTRCTHELWPNTVAVHLLKKPEKWIKTLKYFNVTSNLKPSKLYHIR